MPENLYQIITVISEETKKQEPNGYLVGFERLIDPVLIGALFGLYKSEELPPMDEEEISLQKSYEFGNVEISTFAGIFNHFLFCLWVKKKGLPDKPKDIVKYREELYGFIRQILDAEHYRRVVIPFYLKKADESEGKETSFLYRLWNSDNIGLELQRYSPEYLALEFKDAQEDFIKNVIVPLGKEE
jgi:hypothetical protein